jgi:predicted metal-dependent phosphotriesterase family hydrolase
MRMFISILLRHGLAADNIRQMAQANPAHLLGLSPKPGSNAG